AMAMFTIARHGDSHPAQATKPLPNPWQGHNRRLTSRHGQAAYALWRSDPGAVDGYQANVRLWHELPQVARNRGLLPGIGVNASGEIQPLLPGNPPTLNRRL